MSDYIKREDAIKATYGFERYTGIDEAPVEFAYNILRDIPSADVVERKRGTYRDSGKNDEWYCHWTICNECGAEWMGDTNFCPNCGADMREREGE